MARSRQHLCQQGEVNLAVGVIKLAGGANQQLSGGAWLNVKGHRGAAGMGAGTVSQLNQLVAEQGEEQQDLMPLFADLQADNPQRNEGILDLDNMPLNEEPQCVINELNLFSKHAKSI